MLSSRSWMSNEAQSIFVLTTDLLNAELLAEYTGTCSGDTLEDLKVILVNLRDLLSADASLEGVIRLRFIG